MLNDKDKELLEGCYYQNVSQVQSALTQGADVNCRVSAEDIPSLPESVKEMVVKYKLIGCTPLHFAFFHPPNYAFNGNVIKKHIQIGDLLLRQKNININISLSAEEHIKIGDLLLQIQQGTANMYSFHIGYSCHWIFYLIDNMYLLYSKREIHKIICKVIPTLINDEYDHKTLLKEILKCSLKIAALRESVNLLSKENLDVKNEFLNKPENEEFKEFYSSCVEEIEKMKNTKIGDSTATYVTYFQFICQNDWDIYYNKQATFLNETTIKTELELKNYEQKFPLYKDHIKDIFDKAKERHNLLSLCENHLTKIEFTNEGGHKIDIAQMPGFMKKQIIDELSNRDLINLMKASKSEAKNPSNLPDYVTNQIYLGKGNLEQSKTSQVKNFNDRNFEQRKTSQLGISIGVIIGASLGLLVSYLTGFSFTLTFIVSAAIGALVGAAVGYGVTKVCKKVSDEKKKNPDIGTWSALTNVLIPRHSKEQQPEHA